MSDNWRIRIQPREAEHGETLLERLGLDLGSDEAKRLAEELQGHRLAVSRDDDTIFVYAETKPQADQARGIVEAELAEEGIEAGIEVERWVAEEERWSGDPPEETWEEQELAHNHAPWEVRIECSSHEEADALADRLEQEGQDVVRRWTYVLVGASSRDEAQALAKQLHGEVEAGGEVVYEAMPRNPFAIFGGFGG